MDLEADVQIGDFKIIRRLGAGGMGVVYLARQVGLDRLVALKVIGAALTDRSDIARFHREAQAVAKLNHPGVVKVYFVGQDRHVCFIAMEYVEGGSLRDFITCASLLNQPIQSTDEIIRSMLSGDNEALPLRFDQATLNLTPEAKAEAQQLMERESGSPTSEAKRLMSNPDYMRRCCEMIGDAGRALAHAHEQGVIHRDIKPENILLDRQARSHLIDFGLARFFEDVTITSTGTLLGTPLYMSPEQVSGRLRVDHRTDIYSLGQCLYELLTLEQPITAPTREGILRQIVTKALRPLSRKNKAVSRDLESVVHKATMKDPDDRYNLASLFVADLDNVLGSRPVEAHSYRYKFDDREIELERPSEMVFLSVFLALMSIVVFALAIGTMILVYDTSTSRIYYLRVSALVPLSVLFFVAAIQILFARTWARNISVFNCIMSSLISLYLILDIATTLRAYVSFKLPWLLSLFACCISAILPYALIYVMFRSKTNRWFAIASRLRNEQKQASS